MFTSTDTEPDQWDKLTDPASVQQIIDASNDRPQLVYKHSHTCSVCYLARKELERAFDAIEEKADMHFVNVVKARPVSNDFAEELDVRHESPQVLIIHNGEAVYNVSHHSIESDEILAELNEL